MKCSSSYIKHCKLFYRCTSQIEGQIEGQIGGRIEGKLLARFALCFALASTAPPAAFAASPTVAAVNDETITEEQLNNEFSRQFNSESPHLDAASKRVLRKRLLQKIIDRKLLFQEAKAKGLLPPDSEVQQLFEHEKERFRSAQLGAAHSPARSFQDFLSRSRQTEAAYRLELITDLAIRRYVDEAVFPGAEPGEEELQSASLLFAEAPRQLRLRHILLRGGEGDLSARAGEILASANSGGDFAALAKQHSASPSRAKGGDIGYVTDNQLPVSFGGAAVGTLFGPIIEGESAHILKVEEVLQPTNVPEDEKRHLIRSELTRKKQSAALFEHIKSLRQKARIILNID